MAAKTITIDREAYERLKRLKREDESFSQTIKRITPKAFDYQTWLKKLGKNPASDGFIAAVEAQVAQRRAGKNSSISRRQGRK